MSLPKKRRGYEILLWGAIGCVLLVNLLPWLWMLLAAFKTRAQLLSPVPRWIFQPTLENFPAVFLDRGFLQYLLNSIGIGVASMLLSLLAGVPAAYCFSRFRIRGREHLFFNILTTRMAPPVVFALPLYILFAKLQILGTHLAVILGHTSFTLAFVIWLMHGFFTEVPTELDEAARLDGCTAWRAFWHVVLPLVKPGLVAAAVFAFLFSWNEFLFSLVLAGQDARTLPAAFPGLVTPHGTYWGQVAAAGFVASIPGLILVFCFQRYLVRGLTAGAVH